jgi:WD40 repeat protein
MKFIASLAVLLAAFGPDVTPRLSPFYPRRLVEERTFDAPGLWLMAPGGKVIATAMGGDSFGLIDVATGRNFELGDHKPGGRHDGNFGQSERYLATTANDGPVKVWDAVTRKEIASFKPHGGYT